MKVALYSPYLDTAGGGEKYILTIAETLFDKEEVDILLGTHLYDLEIEKYKERIKLIHGIDLSKINFVKSPIGKKSSFINRLFFLKKYDYFFYLTDGSLFFSTAKNNFVHFQVPFENINIGGAWGKIKLSSWGKAIYNSRFTQKIVEKVLPIPGIVIYPPVSTNIFHATTKKNQIISVGRFFGFLKDKKHKFLINTFKQLIAENNLPGWSLHLVGGASSGDKDYLEILQKEIGKARVYLHPNASLEELVKLYGESKIYWHASGFGETDPKKFEHFGITTVEAMASGCVPVVIKKGGQLEIVEDGETGFLWDNLAELKEKTLTLINNPDKMKKMSKNAQEKSQQFSKEKFQEKIQGLIYE